ncbi:MAG: hypothetical protein OEY05_05050 [Paracoccaceae bacterium]|nr:hypothetical protein [Paracoccaceae bacterium]MDH5529388.1 hypothetical protein [Paracoccaceae bacterium]
MSDSQANVAIQDVLSSIRRLVSEDLRTEPRRGREVAAEATEVKTFEGKLVLTDALRVDEPTEITAQASETAVESFKFSSERKRGALSEHAPVESVAVDEWGTDNAEDALNTQTADDAETVDTEATAAGSLEDTIAELEAAVAGIDEAFEPDGSEEKSHRESAVDGGDDALEFSFPVDEADDDTQQRAEEPEADQLDAPITSDGLAMGGSGEPVEDSAEAEIADVHSETVVKKGLAVRLGFEEDDFSNGRSVHASVESDTADDQTAVEADLGEVDSDANGSDAEVSDDVPGDTEESLASAVAARGIVRRLNFADAQEAEGNERLVLRDAGPSDTDKNVEDADEIALDDDEPVLFGNGDDSIIDTETLRELVTEIIRQELQGPLGERITRNVRKLVRREINRALDVEDAN